MNLFLYKAKLQELIDCKTISQLENLLREYSDKTQNAGKFLNRDYERFKFNYKLYSKAFQLFGQKSKKTLPDFLRDRIKANQKLVLKALKHKNVRLTYEEILDLFEFNEYISIPTYEDCLKIFDEIIKDKPVHFKLANATENPIDAFTRTFIKLPTNDFYIKAYIAAIKYKQTTLKNKNHTIWEQYLSALKQKAKINPTEEFNKVLEEQIQNLIDFTKAAKTFQKELNEQ